MTAIEIMHTHPFATGIAVGILVAYGSLMICTIFFYALERTRAIAQRTAIQTEQGFSDSSVASPDPRAVSWSERT
jgi:hypothetical protein